MAKMKNELETALVEDVTYRGGTYNTLGHYGELRDKLLISKFIKRCLHSADAVLSMDP